VNNRSAFTIFNGEGDITSLTPDPVPSQSLPTHRTEQTPEPTSDRESEPAAMQEPEIKTEPTITLEPEPKEKSD